MIPISFASLQRNIVDVQESGRNVTVRFRCPLSNQELQSRHHMPKDRSLKAQVTSSAQRSFMYAAQRAVSEVIRNVFGYNLVGRVATDVTRTAMYNTAYNNNTRLSNDEREQAIVCAFEKIACHFSWVPQQHAWVIGAAPAPQQEQSAFERQLHTHPVSSPYDRQVLARVLMQVARADGQLSEIELSWLSQLIGPQMDAAALSQQPQLSRSELSSCSSTGVQASILQLAWALALCDEHLAGAEQQVLLRTAQAMGLHSQVQQIERQAQLYILNQALTRVQSWGGHSSYASQQIRQLAQRIGLPEQLALNAEAEFHGRTM